MRFFLHQCTAPEFTLQNAVNVDLTLDRIRHELESCAGSNTLAVVFMAAVHSGEGRGAIVVKSGGWDEATWALLAVATEAQPNFPRWRKWVVGWLLRLRRWRGL